MQLNAQTGTTLEFGTRGKLGRFDWDASLYQAWLEDELLSLQVGNFNPPITQTLNAGRTIHRGVELGGGWRVVDGLLATGAEVPNDGIRLQGNYLFNDFRFDGDTTYGDNRLPGVPRHYLRGELKYQHPSGFTSDRMLSGLLSPTPSTWPTRMRPMRRDMRFLDSVSDTRRGVESRCFSMLGTSPTRPTSPPPGS